MEKENASELHYLHQRNPYVLINYNAADLETQQVSVLDELTKVVSNLELKENTNLIRRRL